MGFSVDVARAYAEARGVSIEWVRFRWPELAADLAAGRFDLALSGVTVRPDRALLGRFSLPLTTSGAVVLLPRQSERGRRIEAGEQARDVLDDGAIRIAVNAGGHLEAVARQLFPAAQIIPVPSNAAVLDRLRASGDARADAVMTDSREAPHWRARRPGLIATAPLTQDRKAAWFPIPRAHLVPDFDAWLIEFEASGGLADLRARSQLPPATTARPIEALWATLDDRLALMVDVAESKRLLGKAVEDLPREAQVLDAAVLGFEREARRRGLREIRREAVRRLFRAQIEAAKSIQRDHLAQSAAPAKHSGTARDHAAAQRRLDEEIRPALIFLGERIARLLVACSLSPDKRPAPKSLLRAIRRHAIAAEQATEIEEALDALLRRDAGPRAQSAPREWAETGTPGSG
jgi:cyclohexadienyl dehydratase